MDPLFFSFRISLVRCAYIYCSSIANTGMVTMHITVVSITPFTAKFTSALYCSEKITEHMATGIAASIIMADASRLPVPIISFTMSSRIRGGSFRFR